MDMLKVNTPYAITINPDDCHQYFNKKDRRIRHINTYFVNHFFTKWKETIDFQLFPEFSNPWRSYTASKYQNKHVRYHWHGVIFFKDTSRWYEYLYNDLIKVAQIEIDTIDDEKYWADYCTKNKESMKPNLRSNRLDYKIDSDKIKYIKNSVSDMVEDPLA